VEIDESNNEGDKPVGGIPRTFPVANNKEVETGNHLAAAAMTTPLSVPYSMMNAGFPN
jgi:hypothetical protein